MTFLKLFAPCKTLSIGSAVSHRAATWNRGQRYSCDWPGDDLFIALPLKSRIVNTMESALESFFVSAEATPYFIRR